MLGKHWHNSIIYISGREELVEVLEILEELLIEYYVIFDSKKSMRVHAVATREQLNQFVARRPDDSDSAS